MKINEIMKFENKIFSCDEHDIYVKVVNNNGLEVVASRYLDEFTDQCPLLEQLHTLNDILNMEFVEVKEYSIKEILTPENQDKCFIMLNYGAIVNVDLFGSTVPVAYVVGQYGIREDLLETTYSLESIVNAKFVEVK